MSIVKVKLIKEKNNGMLVKDILEKHHISQYMYYKLINDKKSGGGKKQVATKKKSNEKEQPVEKKSITKTAIVQNMSTVNNKKQEPIARKYRNLFMELANHAENPDLFIKATETITDDKEPPYITFDDIKHTLPYVPGENIITPNTHRGQRKLFLSELEFLTLWCKNNKINAQRDSDKLPYVVYVGAAPNNKMFLLHKLFPHFTFILIDPAPFDINVNGISHRKQPFKEIIHLKTNNDNRIPYFGNSDYNPNYIKTITSNKTAKIFIIEDFMTTALGKILKQLGDILFISDIRTTINDRAPSNLDIVWNNAQQYNWIKSMNPLLWMVKFRTAFFDDNNLKNDSYNAISENEIVQNDFNEAITNGIDFIADYKKKKFVFFDGIMYLQCFPRYKSTETRLVSDKMEIREYDMNDYESKLYYYNTIKRGYQLHENNNAGVVEGFDYCNCCAKENYLWTDYLKVNTIGGSIDSNFGRKSIDALINALTFSTRQTFLKDGHGFFTKLNEDFLKYVYSKRNINEKEKDTRLYKENARKLMIGKIKNNNKHHNNGKWQHNNGNAHHKK
uniref:Cap-specific mRNA (nucleoside-2'-O-)-methyltransferase n=1 Tax=viral metagenome TaxID=1070528 RepID=A0A6C0BBT6_9ZZZZ